MRTPENGIGELTSIGNGLGSGSPPARSEYLARLAGKLAGMMAAAEAIGSGASDAALLRRLSLEFATIASTAPSYGLDSAAKHAIEADEVIHGSAQASSRAIRLKIGALIDAITRASCA